MYKNTHNSNLSAAVSSDLKALYKSVIIIILLLLPHTLKIDCSLTCNNPFSFHLQVKQKMNVRLGVRLLLARPVLLAQRNMQ